MFTAENAEHAEVFQKQLFSPRSPQSPR